MYKPKQFTKNKGVKGPLPLHKQLAMGIRKDGKKPGDLKSKPKGKEA